MHRSAEFICYLVSPASCTLGTGQNLRACRQIHDNNSCKRIQHWAKWPKSQSQYLNDVFLRVKQKKNDFVHLYLHFAWNDYFEQHIYRL